MQQPEFMLPYLVYLLAHHPDMPPLGPDATSPPDPSILQSFCAMLQLALEALLVPAAFQQHQGSGAGGAGGAGAKARGSGGAGGAHGVVGASLALVLKLLVSVKAMEDADKVRLNLCGQV